MRPAPSPGDVPVRHHRVVVPGATLHVVEAGPPDGAPLVLLHGFPETWWSWRHQLGPLAAAGVRVIAPDLRGYGLSSLEGPHDLATLAADIAALVRALELGPVPLVGHDWGGATAWAVAADHPETVSRLGILNCPLPYLMQRRLIARPTPSQLQRSWYMFLFQLPWLPEWLLGRRGGRGLVSAIRGAARHRDAMRSTELQPFAEAALRPGALSAMLGPYRASLRGILRGRPLAPPPIIRQPTLVVWGMADPLLGFDALVPGTERWVPDLRIERLDGVGHFPQSEAPERVNPLLLALARG